MSGDGGDRSGREERLQEVLVGYLEAAERGQAPEPAELLARHPEFAAELAGFLADRARLEGLAAPLRTAAEVGAGCIPAAPGDTVRYLGDYELLGEIARGGMGIVFKARQVSLHRLVALKMILRGERASEADVRRFRAEAEAAANLDHPGIVPIYEVGEHQGQHYFSMKLIEGGSLAQRLPEFRADPASGGRKAAEVAAARTLAQVARAVHHAHQRGILHRDLKPANILIDSQGQAHVTDFGLARSVKAERGQTQSGAIVGTPAYMPPEQARGEKVLTTAIDVYAVGAILYEWLTGRPPFRGDTPVDVLLQVLEREPVRPRAVHAAVDRDLETICLKCLEKEPGRRYGSTEALAEDLERWLKGEPIAARPASGWERARKWARRHPSAAALVLVSAASLLAIAALAAFHTASLSRENTRTREALADAEEARGRADEAHGRAEDLLYASRIPLAYAEWRNHYIDRAENLLDEYHFSDRRGWEWHYLKGLCHRDLQTFPGQHWVAYSPDGKLLATVARADKKSGLEGEVTVVRDAANGDVRFQLPSRKGRSSARFAFTPDGKVLIALDTHGGFRTWDMTEGKMLLDVPGKEHSTPHGYLAVCPKGRHVALLEPDRLTIREVATGKEAHVIPLVATPDLDVPQPIREVGGVAFSPDGTRLAAGIEKDVWVFDTTTWKQPRLERGHGGQVMVVAFSPDGRRLLSGSEDGTLRLWDQTGALVAPRVLRGHRRSVNGAAFSRDGRWIASNGPDSTVRLWDAERGAELATLRGHDPARQWLPASLHHDPGVRALAQFKATQRWPTAVSFHPDGKRLASVCGDDQLKVWDLAAALSAAWPATIDTRGLCDLAFSPDGRRLAVGRVLEEREGARVRTVGQVELWDTTTGERTAVLDPATREMSQDFLHLKRVAFSADGKQLATVDARVAWASSSEKGLPPPADVRIWDTATGRLVRTLEKAGEQVVFSPDGRWIAVLRTSHSVQPAGGVLRKAEGGSVRFWDARTGEPAFALDERAAPVGRLAFTPDGRYLVTARKESFAKRAIVVWEMTADGPRPVHRFGEGGITSLAVSPDGRYLATAEHPGDVDVWELPSGRPIAAIREARGETGRSWNSGNYSLLYSENHLAFSPDGKRLAYATLSTLRLWDPRSGLEVLALEKDPERIYRIHFSLDGHRLILLGANEHWRVFDAVELPPERLYGRGVLVYVEKLVKSLRLKSLVVERIRTDPLLDDAFRSMALEQTRGMFEDAIILNLLAWDVAVQPGLTAEEYARALQDAETGARLTPDDPAMLNTLGAAQYRAGLYTEALRTLLRSQELHRQKEEPALEDDAFLAMTYHRLGKTDEARTHLEKLRSAIADPRHGDNAEHTELLREVERLIEETAP